MDPLRDETLHPPSDDPYWQESWYFNFADPTHDLWGLTRIGYRPATGRADGLFVACRGERLFVLHAPVGRRLDGPEVELTFPELRVGGLRFRCESPDGVWRLALRCLGAEAELRFVPFTPIYAYPPPVGEAGSAASDHYEAAGEVVGTVACAGETWSVTGWGQRDHSWGPRHWAGVARWLWISAQFPSGWAFNLWQVGKGTHAPIGFVGTRAAVEPLRQVGVSEPPSRARRPVERLRIELATDERRCEIDFERRCFFPLYKGGAVIGESFGHFRCGDEVGVGVVEVLRRESPWPLVPWALRMAALAWRCR